MRKHLAITAATVALLAAGITVAHAAPSANCSASGPFGLAFYGQHYQMGRDFTIWENGVQVAGPETPGSGGTLTLFQLLAPVGLDTITVERPGGSVAGTCSVEIG